MKLSLLAGLSFSMIACAGHADDADASGQSQDLVSDVISMVKRPDGNFDVSCKGKNGGPDYLETRAVDQIGAPDICEHPPVTSSIAKVDERIMFADTGWTQGEEISMFPTDLWDGYASFLATASTTTAAGSHPNCQYDVIDGDNRLLHFVDSSRFERVKLPIRIRASTISPVMRCFPTVNVTDASIEVTATKPQLVAGQFANDASPHLIESLGAEIVGATMHFTASAKLFENFENGNACSTIELVDRNHKTVVLSSAAPALAVALEAPIRINHHATCLSSRLATPENADDDYRVEMTGFLFDNAR